MGVRSPQSLLLYRHIELHCRLLLLAGTGLYGHARKKTAKSFGKILKMVKVLKPSWKNISCAHIAGFEKKRDTLRIIILKVSFREGKKSFESHSTQPS